MDNILACQMWCELQDYTAWTVCAGAPICPFENYTAPHNYDLCKLWTENVNVENLIFGASTPFSTDNLTPLHSTDSRESHMVECIYSSLSREIQYPEYCELWCETQYYLYGYVCASQITSTLNKCPYAEYTDSSTLCLLWQGINIASNIAKVTDIHGNYITDAIGNPLTESGNNLLHYHWILNRIT